jgi:hypothetical protein
MALPTRVIPIATRLLFAVSQQGFRDFSLRRLRIATFKGSFALISNRPPRW